MTLHPSAYDSSTTAPSWWVESDVEGAHVLPPLEGDRRCEIAVVGGGYTGLSAAFHLAREHGREVCVLEAGQPGWGASGRNGGFCCMGATMLSPRAMSRRFGLTETQRFYSVQTEAVDLVRSLGEREGIAFEAVGEGEYQLAHKPRLVETLRAEQGFLRQHFGFETRLYDRAELTELGMAGPEFYGALHVPVGFGLHPLRYARGLATAAERAGATVLGDSRVVSWCKRNGKHHLTTLHGSLRADKLVIATNAYTPEGLVAGVAAGLLPALSSIVVTRPLTLEELVAQGWTRNELAYDSRALLHYFRLLPGGRFLFGGRGGTSAHPNALQRRREVLTGSFRTLFPAWRTVEISHYWSGLVCIASDRVPHVSQLPEDPTVAYALAYHGNGVAMATWLGRAVAGLVTDTPAVTREIPSFVRSPLKPFPFPALRPWYLRAAYFAAALEDRL